MTTQEAKSVTSQARDHNGAKRLNARLAILFVIVAVSGGYLWNTRLEFVNVQGPQFFMVNKWTGVVNHCTPDQCKLVGYDIKPWERDWGQR